MPHVHEYEITIEFKDAPEKSDDQITSSPFPDDDDCFDRFKLRLEKSSANKTNLEILHWNSQCTAADKEHTFEIFITHSCYRFNTTLETKCHTWKYLTELWCAIDDTKTLVIKVKVPNITIYSLSFEALEDEDALRDFTLESNCAKKYRIEIHRVVFAAHSVVFRDLLKEIKDSNIVIDGDYIVLFEFVRYLYQVKRPQLKFWELLKLARQYGMEDLENKCIAGLFENITVHNALDTLSNALINKCPSLMLTSANFFKNNYDVVLSESLAIMLPTDGDETNDDETSIPSC